MEKTRLSSKGQIVLPKSIREAHGWTPGLELVIEDLPDGIRLRTAKPFPPSRLEDVYGCLPYRGKAKTIEDMDAGIEMEVRRRHARGRY